MAGDWLPIRLHLESDPAVMALSALTGIDVFGVVGRMVAVWAWAGDHADENGLVARHAASVTQCNAAPLQPCALRAHIDEIARHKGWADAMQTVGWLADSEAGLVFPRWDVYNSKSARARMLSARRSQAYRDKSASRSRHGRVTKSSRLDQSTAESALSADIAQRTSTGNNGAVRARNTDAEQPLRGQLNGSADAAAEKTTTEKDRARAMLFLVDGKAGELEGLMKLPQSWIVSTAMGRAGCDESFREALKRRCDADREACAVAMDVYVRWFTRRRKITNPGAWIRTALAAAKVEF